jgi:N-acetylneuraminic acid mutarotase
MKRLYTFISFLFLTIATNAQGTWHVQAQFAGAMRYRATSFVVNGKCYVGTGCTGSTNNLQDLWEYDPITNAWTQKADLTGPKRVLATGSSDGTYGYIGLGMNNGAVYNDWWQFDPQANSWMQKTSFPSTKRYGAGTFNIGNRVYVGGGIDSLNSVHSDFYVYDGTTDSWTSRHALPSPVCEMAAYVINGKGYFVGGAINGGTSASTQNAEYDPVSDTWAVKTSFAGGNIYSCVGFALDGMGYVGTGFAGNLTDIMYRWDPVSDTWTQETYFPNGIRQFAVCCNVNNRAFIGTGNSTAGNLFNDWWEFIPVTTGINKHDIIFPNVFFDQSSKQIIVVDATGTENFEVMTVDGKLTMSGRFEKGNNLLFVQSAGVYLIRIQNDGVERVVKVVRAE